MRSFCFFLLEIPPTKSKFLLLHCPQASYLLSHSQTCFSGPFLHRQVDSCSLKLSLATPSPLERVWLRCVKIQPGMTWGQSQVPQWQDGLRRWDLMPGAPTHCAFVRFCSVLLPPSPGPAERQLQDQHFPRGRCDVSHSKLRAGHRSCPKTNPEIMQR